MGQGLILISGDGSPSDSRLRAMLAESGFLTMGAKGVDTAIDLLRSSRFDLLLLDFDVPGLTGIKTCKEIRTFSNLGIILLAPKSGEKYKVEALLSGADDFLTKPFGKSELLARIRGVIRRCSGLSRLECSQVSLGDVEIDFDRRRVRTGDREERLTPKEFDLLRCLVTRANQTVRHRDLLQAAWGLDYGTTEHCLRYYVGKLRKKIEVSPDQPKYLLTVPWVGYQLRLPE